MFSFLMTSPATSRSFSDFWTALGHFLPLSSDPPPPTEQPRGAPQPLEEPLLLSLQQILKPEQIRHDPDTLSAYAGGYGYPGFIRRQSERPAPAAVVFPENDREIAALMQWVAQREIQLLPWGGGADPYGVKQEATGPFLVVALERMNHIAQPDPETGQLHVEAGTRWSAVEQSLADTPLTTGQFFPSTATTLGGSIASNTPGVKTLTYRPLMEILSQIRAVCPSGPFELQRPWPGMPDERSLMLGSHGNWGIITRVTLRLLRKPQERQRLVASFPSWPAALAALRSMLGDEGEPTSAQIITGREVSLFNATLSPKWKQLLRSVRGGPTSSGKIYLILELAGHPRLVNDKKHRVEEILHAAEAQTENHKKLPLPVTGPHSSRQEWLEQLWRRNMLADTFTAFIPWPQASKFLRDWEEALTSILQATGEAQALPLTTIYATAEYAQINTLIIGRQAAGGVQAHQTQLESIQEVARETQQRWGGAARPSPLAARAITAAEMSLDPDGIMLR
ncbi:MAG: FAD-binding protein [Anaerolineae bacterium]|nr:FAD-binding protein [Anaerolineae bacterium]